MLEGIAKRNQQGEKSFVTLLQQCVKYASDSTPLLEIGWQEAKGTTVWNAVDGKSAFKYCFRGIQQLRSCNLRCQIVSILILPLNNLILCHFGSGNGTA